MEGANDGYMAGQRISVSPLSLSDNPSTVADRPAPHDIAGITASTFAGAGKTDVG